MRRTCSPTRPRRSRPSSARCPAACEAEVTGPAGFAADAVEVFNDINGTLLLRDRGAGAGAADHHLPQPDLLDDPVLLGADRRGDHARARLPARRRGRDRHRPVRRHPAGARVRRRDRLRAADGLALPRGAAPARGQARRHPRDPAPDEPRNPRLGRDGDGGAADAVAGRGQRDLGPRADRRAGHRDGDDLDADHPPRPADGLRAQGLLALHPARRQRGHRRDPRRLAADRRVGGPRARDASGSAPPRCSS